jgi:ubiquinone/menaquinone biosynthesis C-methylase UbiE
MEGSVARWYERTTRTDMAEFTALAARFAAHLPPGGAVLEVAPGPGFLAIELARLGFEVLGIDISRTFVELARANAAAAPVRARFEWGDASALPIPDASRDGVVCRAAFKNFATPVQALREMNRVLRPGGTALLVDLRRDASLSEIRRFVDTLGVGPLNRAVMMATFRWMLLKRAYTVDQIRRMAAEAGWTQVRIEVQTIGFEAWMRR